METGLPGKMLVCVLKEITKMIQINTVMIKKDIDNMTILIRILL